MDRQSVRRLIETDEMPIRIISEYSRRDQNVKKGHLHTLHVWWATRPGRLPGGADGHAPARSRGRALSGNVTPGNPGSFEAVHRSGSFRPGGAATNTLGFHRPFRCLGELHQSNLCGNCPSAGARGPSGGPAPGGGPLRRHRLHPL
ncbi:MAG: DUF1156 domain-containing protein [Firmicutes bacterium]|nr:DUF1156 domain-containing protein [Bacillota bacterium]